MKDIIKKNWFLGILAVVFVIGFIYLAIDSLKPGINGKQNADGKDLIFSYGEYEFTADDLMAEVKEKTDFQLYVPLIEAEIYRNALVPTKAMEVDAKANTKAIINNFKSQYGEDWEAVLNNTLISAGYLTNSGEKGLYEYLLISEIRTQVEIDYLKTEGTILSEYMTKEEPRLVSHILVKMADPENPTEAETKKLEEVKAELAKEGSNFGELARMYSDDTGSAQKNGSLGMVTKTSNAGFVAEFQANVYTKGYGERTDWFKTEFGYHIIRVDATTIEEFEQESDYSIYEAIFKDNAKLRLLITWEQINKQEIKFTDDAEFNALLKKYYLGEETK